MQAVVNRFRGFQICGEVSMHRPQINSWLSSLMCEANGLLVMAASILRQGPLLYEAVTQIIISSKGA
eukprot:c41396_g1_i1 orf=112-312(+)